MKSCVSIKNHFLAVSLYQIVFCYLSEVWFRLNCHFSVSQLYSITKVKLDYRGFKYNVSVQDPIQSNNYRKGSWCCFLVRPLAKHFFEFFRGFDGSFEFWTYMTCNICYMLCMSDINIYFTNQIYWPIVFLSLWYFYIRPN